MGGGGELPYQTAGVDFGGRYTVWKPQGVVVLEMGA